MPLDFLSVPLYPSIPAEPGVPALLRDPAGVPSQEALPYEAQADATQPADAPVYGLFDSDGQPALIADTCVSFEFSQDKRLATAPQEGGGFMNYNKVTIPFAAKLTLSKGGTERERSDFLNAADAVCESLDLYTVVTPEAVYQSVNCEHYDYRRTREAGATLITVEIWLQEIRQAGTTTFSHTQTQLPSAADPVNVGSVQAQPAATPVPEFY